MREEGAHENWYPQDRSEQFHDAGERTGVLASVADRAVGRFFAIGLQLDRALSLTLNAMARERIDRAISEANEAIIELMEAVFEGRRPPEATGSKRVVVHPEAWTSLDGSSRVAYSARAAQLGVTLEVGDTGVASSKVILVLDEKAEWFPTDGRSHYGNRWEQKLQELLNLD
jgi:hypothetical protein